MKENQESNSYYHLSTTMEECKPRSVKIFQHENMCDLPDKMGRTGAPDSESNSAWEEHGGMKATLTANDAKNQLSCPKKRVTKKGGCVRDRA